MKIAVLLFAIVHFSWAKPNNVSAKLFVDTINSKKPTWKAGVKFSELIHAEDIKKRLGFLGLNQDPNYHIDIKTHKIGRTVFPENFDAREKWPACRDVIDNIRDQGHCGSCWAFSSAEVMADRLCIQTNGELKFEFSPQELVSCCSYCGLGCDGGYTTQAWNYWEKTGIVSGGDYNTNKGCKPYPEKAYLNGSTLQCTSSCSNNNYETPYQKDRRYGLNHKMLPTNNVEQMMNEIMTSGPVQASYSVYEDFAYYENGVYYHVYGDYLGGHAVKIMGWGVEDKIPYWLVANSWGPDWGLKGYFKIRKGSNECGIEAKVIVGEASLRMNNEDEDIPGSSIKIISSSVGLLLSGLVFFILFD